jgi:hypothetical protein
MKKLIFRPNIITLIFAAAICLVVFAVQAWMTDQLGDTGHEE